MDSIHALRSTLHYSQRRIADGLIRDILRVAMTGQEGIGLPALQFVVIDDRRILEEIPTFHSSAHMLHEAPVAILVCSENCRQRVDSDRWFRASASVSEHLLMAVQSKGLGAVRLSIYPVVERIAGMQKLLGLPQEMVPLFLIPIGYPSETRPLSRRYDPARVHFNHW